MRLTRETEYALLGLRALARRPRGASVTIDEVAAAEDLPRSFLAKIFQKLSRHGILESSRGPGRGFTLIRAPESVSSLEVIEAVEGPDYLDRCVFWTGRCGVEPCLLHERFSSVKPLIRSVLERTTLADLASSVQTATER